MGQSIDFLVFRKGQCLVTDTTGLAPLLLRGLHVTSNPREKFAALLS